MSVTSGAQRWREDMSEVHSGAVGWLSLAAAPTFSWRRPRLHNLFGRAWLAAQRHGPDVLADERLSFAALAEADLQPICRRSSLWQKRDGEVMTMTQNTSVKFLITSAGARTEATGNSEVRQLLAAQLQMTPYLIEYLSRVAEAHQRGDFDVQTDIVREVGGAPPKSPDAFVAESRGAFGG